LIPSTLLLIAVHRQSAASKSAKPLINAQHWLEGGVPTIMLTSPKRSAQAPSFNVSLGHEALFDGGEGGEGGGQLGFGVGGVGFGVGGVGLGVGGVGFGVGGVGFGVGGVGIGVGGVGFGDGVGGGQLA